MEPKKNTDQQAAGSKAAGNEHTIDARKEAQKDIDNDAELSIHSPNDDLDEGELARLGEDDNGVV